MTIVADVGLPKPKKRLHNTAMLVRLGSDVCGHSIPHYLIISVHPVLREEPCARSSLHETAGCLQAMIMARSSS